MNATRDRTKPWCSIVTLVVACCTAGHCIAQSDNSPHLVYVDQEGVTARCGPGPQFYRTDPLRHGQSLEVYVETDDGWLGVRPPDESFCWLPADVLKVSKKQDFAIVTEDETLAWIGTHLGKANKYLWQVALAKGEEVAILGRAKREGADGIQLWYRIVPPAGEFRWIHRDQVVENPELLVRGKPSTRSEFAHAEPTIADEPAEVVDDRPRYASSTRSDQNEVDAEPRQPTSMRTERSVIGQADAQSASPSRPDDVVIGSGVVPAINVVASNQMIARHEVAPQVSFTSAPVVQAIGHNATLLPPASMPQELADSFDRRNATAPAMTSMPAAYQVQSIDTRVVVPTSSLVPMPSNMAARRDSVDGLQLELSRLMSRSASAAEVQGVLDASIAQSRENANPQDRARAAMIVQRAQQYQQIAQRRDFQSPGTISLPSNPMSIAIPTVSPQAAPPPLLPMSEMASSESVGFLVQVFSARPDSPPFALTDKQGRTLFYVSPSPGMNLRRYLNQYVSVRGTAGYSTGLDTPHVIATGAVRVAE